MSKMIPVEGHSNLYRDENTNAIINHDSIGYKNYILAKKRNNDKEIEMDNMRREIDELKSLLNDLASKITS